MIVVYDGTFESFLTLVYDVYYKKLQINEIKREVPQTLFMDEILQIEYDKTKTQKVIDALKSKFDNENFQTILNIFMCDSVEFEVDLLQFIIMGFKDQQKLKNINQSFVFNIQNLEKELFRFNHKMTGFLRFEELEDGTLYAKIDVKFNIIYFLGKHFIKRFSNQRFIIHDRKRELAFIYNDQFRGVQTVSSFEGPTVSKDEQKFKKLWKTFFDSSAIESRKNEKLQRQFVPLLYRTYMTEFNY